MISHQNRQQSNYSIDSNFGARRRRAGVSGESVTREKLDNWVCPFFRKTEEQIRDIIRVIDSRLQVLFGHLDYSQKKKVVCAMFQMEVEKGKNLIKQGEKGDNFYIVEEGVFDIYVSHGDTDRPQLVMTSTPGMSFGELALLYNAPRAATCTAREDSKVWALDRVTFQMMLVTAENTKKATYLEFLSNIEIFGGLNKGEKAQLSDILSKQEFRPGECIVRQGERGDRFYIVEKGQCICTITEKFNEVEVYRYKSGGYFGELALITRGGIRKASVYAKTHCSLLWIDKSTFDRVLGPIMEKLEENADLYPSYADVIKSSA